MKKSKSVALVIFACLVCIIINSFPPVEFNIPSAQYFRLHTLRRELRDLQDSVETHETQDKLDVARLAFNSFQPFVEEPLLILKPKTVGEIKQILQVANTYNISVSILGGGHHGAGWCLSRQRHAFVIQLVNFKKMQILQDGEYIKLGAGLEWGAVYDYVQENLPSRVVVGGMDRGVGIVGYLLAGGLGYFSRKHGYAADSVVQWEVVLGNGTLTKITHKSNAELHSLMKGSVGIPFGIIVSVTIRTYPKQQSFGCSLSWKFKRQEFLDLSVFKKFLDETARISDKRLVAYMSGGIQCDNINYNNIQFHSLMFYSGGHKEEGIRLILEYFNRLAKLFNKREITRRDLFFQEDYHALIYTTTVTEEHETYLEGGGFVHSPITHETLIAYNEFLKCKPWMKGLYLNFEHLGGKVLSQKYKHHPSWAPSLLNNTMYVSWFYSAKYFTSKRVHEVRQSINRMDASHLGHYGGYFYPILHEESIPFEKIYNYEREFYMEKRSELGADLFTSYILDSQPTPLDKLIVPLSCRSWRQEGKIVVMSGGTSGMGLLLAQQWIEAGASVFVAARNLAKCNRLLPNAVCIHANLLDRDSIIQFVQYIHKRVSKVHIVYLGAAICEPQKFIEGTKTSTVLQVNFLSVLMIILLLSQFQMIDTLTKVHIPMAVWGEWGQSDLLWKFLRGEPNSDQYSDVMHYVGTKALLKIAKDFLLYNNIADAILQLPAGTSRTPLSGPYIDAHPELFPNEILPNEANVEPWINCLFCKSSCKDDDQTGKFPIEVSLEVQCEMMKHAFSLISFKFGDLQCQPLQVKPPHIPVVMG